MTYFEAAGDALHGDGATTRVGDASLGVHSVRKSVPQGDGGAEHFNANQEVLVTCRDRTGRRPSTVTVDYRRDHIGLF
jgi:hypothetical protein